MSFIEIFLIGLGLSMDVFAVSICKGLSMKKFKLKNALIIALYFCLFQGGTPVIGYYLGTTFQKIITGVDHWIAFILLLLIGINMIKEAYIKKEYNDNVDFKTMIVLALATSVDALIIGITFAISNTNMLLAGITLGVMALVISVVGVLIGNIFGSKYENKAKILGGFILILMGLKILLEHLGLL